MFVGSIQTKLPNSFVTLASIGDMTRFKLKGIDIVLELARIYPHCTFTIIGIQENITNQLIDIPENVFLFPFLAQVEFKDKLLGSEFVLQLSISEGFPNALCEAMLCGCIPIGSSVGAIPRIIDDTGYLIENADIDYIMRKFSDILLLDQERKLELAIKARQRIIENFHISKREKDIVELIEGNQ
jgi:glycosyltransferase involved in cell wall biosynthesis